VHATSQNTTPVTATKRSSGTVVNCSPGSTPVNVATTCTATVTDTDLGTATTPTGTVSWTLNAGSGTFSPTTCTLVAGACSVGYTPAAGSAGSHTPKGTYNSDALHFGSFGTAGVTATVRTTSTSGSCTPNPDAVNRGTTCTATVSDTGSGTTITPTGTVSWTVTTGSGSFSGGGVCTLASGSCSITYTPALGSEGAQTLQAAYGGDVNHSSSSGSPALTVTTRSTSISGSCVPNPDPVNASSTCTATVSDTSAGTAVTPTGTVNWTINTGSGSLGASSCVLSAGACSVTYTPALGSEGAHSLHVAYAGDTDHGTSSNNISVTVSTRSTATAIFCSAYSGPVNSPINCVAQVGDTAAGTPTTPSGTVTWSVSPGAGTFSTPSCSLTFATCFVTFTPALGSAGPQTLHAAYSGDGDHAASSGTRGITATIRSTTVSASCTPATLPVSSATTCTATVSDTDTPVATTPGGTVTWSVNSGAGTFSGTCTLSGGTCTTGFTPAPGAEGVNSLHAAYNGDVDHATSATDTSVTATQRTESMAASCVPASDPVNAATTCTATVTDTDTGTPVTPVGTVHWSVSDGSGSFSSPSCALSGGSCSVTYTPDPGSEGETSLAAAWDGDTDHPADSIGASVSVTMRSSAVNVTCLPATVPVNSATTCTATVSDSDTGTAITPTGSVGWSVTSGTLSSSACVLVSGSCSVQYTPALGHAGPGSIHAVYGGDADHDTSSGDASLTISRRSTATTVLCASAGGDEGVGVSCTASVSDTGTGTATLPSGSVAWSTLSATGTFTPASCTLSGGVCTVTYKPNAGTAGPQTVVGTYSGDADHAVSSASIGYTVTAPVRDLGRFSAGTVPGQHWVTTGPVSSAFTTGTGGEELSLGMVRALPASGFTALYGCQSGTVHFLSHSSSCEGATVLRTEGYVPVGSPNGAFTLAIYRCRVSATNDHFVSTSSSCEGQTPEGSLGFVQPRSALTRYAIPGLHWTAAGTVAAGYSAERILGYVPSVAGSGVALYECRAGSGHFTSRDPGCEGQTRYGLLGWISASGATQPLYRCFHAGDHFDTTSASCEGLGAPEQVLGNMFTTP
jgi:hypothetical protein